MRSKNIDVTLTIPVPINEPDENGNIYTEEAIKEACISAINCPLIQFDNEGNEVPIGIANDVRYSNGSIFVDAKVWYGGTNEFVEMLEDNKITSMKINSIGFST